MQRCLWEVSVQAAAHAGHPAVLQRLFTAAGIPALETVLLSDPENISACWYAPTAAHAAATARSLRAAVPAHVRVRSRVVRPRDWQTRWQRDLAPFAIVPGMRVLPLACARRTRVRSGDIRIDPGLAFGTGLHPTTRAVAGFIFRLRGNIGTFLDVGCGTGILSIVAARCGARRIRAVDISPDAVRAARANLAMNGCRGARCAVADVTRVPVAGGNDLVAANLLVPILLCGRSRLVAAVRPGGHLSVSGIWHTDAARVRAAYEAAGMRTIGTDRRSGWISFLYRREA